MSFFFLKGAWDPINYYQRLNTFVTNISCLIQFISQENLSSIQFNNSLYITILYMRLILIMLERFQGNSKKEKLTQGKIFENIKWIFNEEINCVAAIHPHTNEIKF